MEMHTFQCWIYGDDVDRIFPAKVSSAETVGALKKVIKDEISVKFRDVDAYNLDLYSIPFPDDEQLNDKLNEFNPQGKTKLNGRIKLSKLMNPNPNDDELVLIIVNPPASAAPTIDPPVLLPDVALNCWIRGHEIDRVFRVKVSRSETVADLRKTIKNEKPVDLRDIDADALALYKVSFPYDEDLDEILKGLTFDREMLLRPLSQLSDFFPESPLRSHIHVVVEAPLSTRLRIHPSSSTSSLLLHNVEAQRLAFINNIPSIAPSSGGKVKSFYKRQGKPEQTIYCNRPHDAQATIPTTLLHVAFGQFLDDCEKHEITEDDNALALQLNVAMANFNSDEWTRAQAVREVFSKWGLHLVISQTSDGYATDGDISVDDHRCAIAEFKNEVASLGAEPYNQAVLYYLESTKRFATDMGTSPLPCIIILLFGPYIAFAGATWNLRPVVQPLSYALPMYYHSTDTEMRIRVARHFGAFKKVVRTLEEYYRGLLGVHLRSSPNHSQLFPYPKHFTSLQDDQHHDFKYISQPFQEKLLFFGALSDGQAICIKFVRQYSTDAHLVCASLGFAPRLRGFGEIPGRWFMVVMDIVPSEKYLQFNDINIKPNASLTRRIRNALKQLHDRDHVHGDVRDTNILVSRSDETQFMFVDFDWAGKIGESRYPMNVTRTENLWRPKGAVDGALIKAEHDMDMLDEIEKRYRIKN